MKAAGHLMVFLSNRCNLSCDYCFVAVGEGKPLRLEFDRLRGALDAFLDQPVDAARLVTFLGGEPFMQFPVMLKAVEHLRLRRSAETLVINVYTNGALLSAERLAALRRNDVWTILSLDGAKETNDAHRVFAAGGKSVYDGVMERLGDAPRSRLGVNMVFTPRTAASLAKNIAHFYREGFRWINFYPDLYAVWEEKDLAVFAAALGEFQRYYVSVFEAAPADPFQVPALSSFLDRTSRRGSARPWWRDCGNLVLGADGNFHVCDKAMTFPLETLSDSAIGDPRRGVDWELRDSRLGRAAAAVLEKAEPAPDYVFCPLGTYFHSQWSGGDWSAALKNFESVNRLYREAFSAVSTRLARSEAFRRMYPGAA